MENRIEFEWNEDVFIVVVQPIEVGMLNWIGNALGGTFQLKKFHMVIFNTVEEDTYVTEENISEYIGNDISFSSVMKYVINNFEKEHTVNKFCFQLNTTSFDYDDDSLLIVKVCKGDLVTFDKLVQFTKLIMDSAYRERNTLY